jgi:hypothetical protein
MFTLNGRNAVQLLKAKLTGSCQLTALDLWGKELSLSRLLFVSIRPGVEEGQVLVDDGLVKRPLGLVLRDEVELAFLLRLMIGPAQLGCSLLAADPHLPIVLNVLIYILTLAHLVIA